MASQKQARSAKASGATARGSAAKGATAPGRPGAAAKTGQPGAAKTGQPGAAKTGQPGAAAKTPRPGPAAKAGSAAARRSGTAGNSRRPGPAAQEAAGQPAKAAPEPSAAPLWLRVATLILSLCGLAMSIYLTVAHLTSASILVCSDKGFVNCGAVTTSAESKLFGIFPVSELGLAFYAFMVAVNTPWAWRSKLPALYWARLGSVVVGMVFVLWLVYAELIIIKNLCLLCTSVHVITFLLFTVLVFHASGRPAQAAANQATRQRG